MVYFIILCVFTLKINMCKKNDVLLKYFFYKFFKILVRYFNLKNYHNCLKAHLSLALYTLHLNFMQTYRHLSRRTNIRTWVYSNKKVNAWNVQIIKTEKKHEGGQTQFRLEMILNVYTRNKTHARSLMQICSYIL